MHTKTAMNDKGSSPFLYRQIGKLKPVIACISSNVSAFWQAIFNIQNILRTLKLRD